MAGLPEEYKYSTAHFTNNERTEIEALFMDAENSTDEELVLVPFNIEAKEGDADVEWLLTKVDIDTIHENTFNKFRRENEAFTKTMIDIGKANDMIYDQDGVNSNMYEQVVNTIFSEFVEEDHKEKLFMMKLQLFEMESIKSSKDRETKAKLRKAKNFVDAVKYAALILSPEV